MPKNLTLEDLAKKLPTPAMAAVCKANRLLLFPHDTREECWLPIDPDSRWSYCRHCTYTYEQTLWADIVRSIQMENPIIQTPIRTYGIEEVFREEWFLRRMTYPAARLPFFQMLTSLRTRYPVLYNELLRNPMFLSRYIEYVQSHIPSTFQNCCFISDLVGKRIVQNRHPRRCGCCLLRIWKQDKINYENNLALYRYLLNYNLASYRFVQPQNELKEFLYFCLDTYLPGITPFPIFRVVREHLPHHAYVEWIQNFFFHEPYLSELVSGRYVRVYELAGSEVSNEEFLAEYILPAQQIWKLIQKSRCNIYKEDLMIYTWHPSRLIHWCFDIEEKKEFDDLPEE